MEKYVYSFDEGNKEMKNLLGGKGANLSEMKSLGLPVPDGFIVSTLVCEKYYNDKEILDEEVLKQIKENIALLEKKTGKKFGSLNNPLLVSVRSGARVSMPGMMDTILNLGLNDEVTESFAKEVSNPRFVYDSYRRFIQMFADVVMDFPKNYFEKILEKIKEEKKVKLDTELTSQDLKEIIMIYKKEYKKISGKDFPSDPYEQLLEAIKAVFRSWKNERAITYRRLNDIPEEWGTAVNVQEMVYGNKGETSGTGVAFTRNPATGDKKIFGEYLMNAQGEDVVAGIRTPKSIETLKEILPECYNEFVKICSILESHYRDMQDMEFTIEEGKLYILQTRSGKRTGKAAIKIAVDLVLENVISKEEAMFRVDPKSLDDVLHKTFDKDELQTKKVIAKGLAASPGSATGKIYFSADDAMKASKDGEREIILVRLETSPEDIEGMNIASGVLTVHGGMTSHAAVVARGMGTCCVSGCSDITIDEKNKTLTTKSGVTFHEKDYISIDGNTGNVYEGKIETVLPEISGDFKKFMSWADDIRKLKIRTNADTPKDAEVALNFGAEGIGLCRTEHMFFDKDRIFNFRKMILSENEEERIKALEKILPYQKEDFKGLFKVMKDKPVIIRLLDPPLHEFLPKNKEEITELTETMNISFEQLEERVEYLKEFNPMMGHRGCRLGITYPEIIRMQTRAIIEAALEVSEELNIKIIPEIMIPLVGDVNELKYVKNIIKETINQIIASKGNILYKIGTMIELPRACMTADEIAKEADFFSFGTNDLTQMTYGFSRDDASKFLTDYYNKKILEKDPFASIDRFGVGRLIKIAVEKGKDVNKKIELGICGEHGGEETSIDFCHSIGLNYVSCSPYRVPLARLAAARASINNR